MKNVVDLCGRPLIDYVILAAKQSKTINRLICSTDNKNIASRVKAHGVEVLGRPELLAGDLTPVLDVFIDMLNRIGSREKRIAEVLVILQPTSPFLRPQDIDQAIDLLENDPEADSVQTITSFPHNYHAFNQRVIENGWVTFRFPEERKKYFNKNLKPKHYIFGNLIVTRSQTLLEKKDIFGKRSKYIEIPPQYALDVDGPADLDLAKYYLTSGKVQLPWLE